MREPINVWYRVFNDEKNTLRFTSCKKKIRIILVELYLRILKYPIVILFFIGMLAQSFSWLFIVADYQINKDFIAKYLCENRNIPQMKCNGKCQMMKKLRQEEKKDQQNSERKSDNKFEGITFQLRDIFTAPDYITTSKQYPSLRVFINSDFLSSCFHPPQALGPMSLLYFLLVKDVLSPIPNWNTRVNVVH